MQLDCQGMTGIFMHYLKRYYLIYVYNCENFNAISRRKLLTRLPSVCLAVLAVTVELV